jgi:calcineurin-like phosphoesterase family protein
MKMSEIFFTSDLHFGHNKEFLYKPRGFETIEEHDAAIIRNWNDDVSPDDTVFVLGDIMMGEDHAAGLEKLKQLNGHIIIKRGNHDTNMKMKRYIDLDAVDLDMTLMNSWADMLKFGKWMFYVSHHPTILGDFNCIKPGHKNFCLHGHTHSKDRFQFLQYCCYNVALDAHDNRVVNIKTIQEDLRQKMQELNMTRQNIINGEI